MYCPECGSRLQDDAGFCSMCGWKVGDAEGTSAKDAAKPAAEPAPAGPGTPGPEHVRPSARRSKLWVALAVGVGVLALVALLVFAWGPGGNRGGDAPADSADPGHSPTSYGAQDTWTVLAYYCGSNLETDAGLATANLMELQELDVPGNVSIVLETGGADRWQNDVVDASYLERYIVEDGALCRQDQQPRASMGDPEVLSDFISWGAREYPADHYMLVFWDHGGGSLVGVCADQLNNDKLTLPEMDEALHDAGVHFDVVGFDTCLMATFENAQMLSAHADYLVASEEIEPGGGWTWSWPAWFAQTTTGDPRELGAYIVDGYMEKCADEGVDDAVTLSVVDLGKVGELEEAFYAAAQEMARSTERAGTMQRLIIAAEDVQSFGYANYVEGYTDMVDLGDLVASMGDSIDSEDQMAAAVKDAVVYERHGVARAKATGISVFYPLSIDRATFESYFEMASGIDLKAATYLQYLAVRAGVFDKVNWAGKGIPDLDPVSKEEADGAFAYAGSITDDGRLDVRITGNTEFVAVATYSLGLVLDDGSVASLGSDNDLDVHIGKGGVVDYVDRFRGSWIRIGGNFVHAEIVEMVAEDDKPSYNLYSVPINLTTATGAGKQVTLATNLLIMYDYTTKSYEPVCYYDDIDETGMAGKSTLSIRLGDKLEFRAMRTRDGAVETGTMGSIVWDEDTVVEAAPLAEGTYVYSVTVKDIFGQTHEPVHALITIKDGQRTVTLA